MLLLFCCVLSYFITAIAPVSSLFAAAQHTALAVPRKCFLSQPDVLHLTTYRALLSADWTHRT